MSIEEISSSDPAPRNVAAPTPAGMEVSKSTASITRDIVDALAEDIQQFKGISFSDPAPGKVAAPAWAWREGKDVVWSIKRRFGYVMSSKSYAQDLEKEVQNMAYETERVNKAVEEAMNNVRNVYSYVTEWQASAEKALKEARDLLGEFQELSKTCCHGTLPDANCRYQFSRKAEGKIKVIKQLAQKCSGFKESNDISFSDPAPGNVTAPNPARREREDGVFESRAAIIRDIMGALADHSNSVVGVYGMGGVGKSTLLDNVVSRIREEKRFDLVAKADVSQNPDIKRIQSEIAHALGLDMKDYEYESMRADRLLKRLKNEAKKVLIILDNLWEGLDLKSVGIPCRHDNKVIGCKLLLTSRDQNVLQKQMGCDKDFLLNVLEEKEAKTLFERMVGDKVHDDEFRPLVGEALRKCGSLPLVIVAMAKHLKCALPHEWRDALYQIEWSTNEDISGVINKVLQLSYDHLKNEDAKSLLQLCVAYAVSKPSIENLVRYGYGLGIFQKDSSIEKARDRLRTLIRILQASSLLLDNGGIDGFKIHDLVRDFVACFIFRDRPLLVLKDEDMLATQLLKERLKNCTTICYPYIDMKELPKELDCPELRMFLLFNNNESLEVPDSYFNSTKKLAVLNLTSVHLTRSPTPFQFLEKLCTLSLQNCSLDDVAIVGKLKGLQILSFMNSKIEQLPKEIGQLTELRLLDLNHCSHLQIIEPGVLGKLIKLEELYMENSFNQWNIVEQTQPTNASLIELNHMKNLCTLYVCILDPTMLPEDLDVKKLTKYGIQIGGRCWLSRKGSRILELQLNPKRNNPWKGFTQTALDRADDLYMDELNGIEPSLCKLSPEGFPNLNYLHVENNSFVHYILWQPPLLGLRTLELLCLKSLINLEKICHTHVYSMSFSTLKVVLVESCDKMEVLFPLSLVRELPQLEDIRVVHCNLMREIVEADDSGKVELRNLQVLELCDLPNIKNFCIPEMDLLSSTSNNQISTQVFFSGQQVVFPSLETLNITSMHNFQMIWDNQVYFQHLKSLDVSHCHQLTYVFTSTIARNLVALEKLRISNCKMLIEVFNDDGSKEGHAVAFNQLKFMELDGLTGLRCFSSGGYTLMFPLLEDVIVTRCLNMKVFSKGPIEVPKLEKVQVSIEAWFWEGNLNMTIQKMYEEMATVDGVEFIRLSKFPELIGKWHDEPIPIEPFSKLESLAVDKCPSFINAIPSILMLALHKVSILQVRDCESLEEIFDLKGLEGMESTQVLPQLWHLALVNLPNLRRIWNKDIQGRLHFNFLSHLTVHKCSNLRHTFAPSMVQCLATLKYIELKECGQMEGVIAQEEEHGSTVKKITFPYLCWMELEDLPILTSFLLGKNHTLECPQLKWLTIAHCPYMRSFSGQSVMEIGHGIPSLFTLQVAFPSLETLHITGLNNIEMTFDNQVVANSFPNLKSFCIQECNKLKCIWDKDLHCQDIFRCLHSIRVFRCRSLTSLCPASIAKDLTQLEELEINGCGIVELIEMEEGLFPTFVFPKLAFLRLEDLTKLKCISTGTHALHWRALKTLEVHGCNKVEILASQPKNETPLHKQPLFVMKKDGFPRLETLRITYRDNIEMIWDNFQHLKTLDVSHCNGLPYMFTPTIIEHLVELAELRISNCEMLTEVINDEECKKEHEGASDERKNMELDWLTRLECFTQKEGQGSATKTIRFPNLLRVELECLPNLNSFLSRNNHMLEWPILEELTIAYCPKMTRIGKLFHRPPSFISRLCMDI